MTIRRVAWAGVTLVVAALFFVMAMSAEVYRHTSPMHIGSVIFGSWVADVPHPFSLSLHVPLRKIYSIIAFAIVGFLAEHALPPSRRPVLRMTVLIALYSAAIEYAQWRYGSTEGLGWNAFDVLCGAVGGCLGVAATKVLSRYGVRVKK